MFPCSLCCPWSLNCIASLPLSHWDHWHDGLRGANYSKKDNVSRTLRRLLPDGRTVYELIPVKVVMVVSMRLTPLPMNAPHIESDMLCFSPEVSAYLACRLGSCDRSVLSVCDAFAHSAVLIFKTGAEPRVYFHIEIIHERGFRDCDEMVSFCSLVHVHVVAVADRILPELDVHMLRGPEDIHLIVPFRTHQNGSNPLPTVARC